jgi:hypothetical protein
MNRSKYIPIAIVGGIVAFILLMMFAMPKAAHRVEVCITFEGQSECKTASGATKESALRTAVENACALISGGPTDTVRCQNTPPTKLNWLTP